MHDDHDDDIKGIWTRRAFLKSGGIALFSLGVGGNPLFVNRAVLNSQNDLLRDNKILVTIFQRGAMDGLMAVPKIMTSIWLMHVQDSIWVQGPMRRLL